MATDSSEDDEPTLVPSCGVDFESANAARMYDWFLGGAHNFAVDRDRARSAIDANPHAVALAWANRSFLHRAVEACLNAGIRQFLDLGSGIPTVGNVHEIAHATDPTARVAYVDFEPVAVTHAAHLLRELDTVTITRADLRDPDAVLAAPDVAGLLDFAAPVALLAVSVLHFVDHPWDVATILTRYAAALAPGSAIAISHASDDHDDPEVAGRLRREVDEYRTSATPARTRSRAQIGALLDSLDGFELTEPGLVEMHQWPAPASRDPGGAGFYAALAFRRR